MKNDEYHGQGGSFVINESGQRELVERTLSPEEAAQKLAETQAAMQDKVAKKAKGE